MKHVLLKFYKSMFPQIVIKLSFTVHNYFSFLAAFKIFRILSMRHTGVTFFVLILLEVYYAS